MNCREMGTMWLRDKAACLRTAANIAEAGYSPTNDLGRMCARVALAYRKAAALLDEHATALEDEGATGESEKGDG